MPVSSVERPISALRQRMLEDIAMRSLRSDTQHDYENTTTHRPAPLPNFTAVYLTSCHLDSKAA